jgi:putative hydrolase of the HAD superfamily
MPVRAVLFDMFDTLMMIEKDHAFHSPSLRSAYDFLVANGVDVEYSVFEKAYIEARDALYAKANVRLEEPHFNVRIADALNKLGYAHDVSSSLVSGATNAFCEGFMNFVIIDKHARALLKKLCKRYKLGIVSNFAIPECVLKLLERERLAGFFDVVVVSGAVNKRKPSLDIYNKALDALGVKADETVFVGDTVDADVEGPKKAGMKTVFIERRIQKDVEVACPDQTIQSLVDLPAALELC